jgi:hypothetical protein
MDVVNNAISVSSGINEETTIKADAVAGRYSELAGVRESLLERARDFAALTIPSTFPYQGTSETQEIPSPYQSVGARGVNNLANKLLLTLFPVSSPFFKFEVPEYLVQQLQAEGAEGIKEQFEAKMSEMENIIQSDMEISSFRTSLFEALRALVSVGNFLIHIPSEGEPEGFRFDKYVCKRSNKGTVLELIVKDIVSKEELPKVWEEQLAGLDTSGISSGETTGSSKDKPYEIYTRVVLEDQMYREAKYIHGVKLEGSDATYKKDESAWLVLRWNGLSGEDYGRGYVEEYMGDIIALEGLSQAIQEHSAIASKTFGILRPNSSLSPKDLVNVQNGGFVSGDPEDLAYPDIGKNNDMQVAQATANSLVESISRAFLITQVRDSERTTAAEIRLLATELETALGGAYSLLANTLQKPLLNREIARLKKRKKLPEINDKDLSPKVIVGLEGLGRGTDVEKLMKAAEALAAIAPALQIIQDIDQTKLIQFVFNGVGLDTDEILKSPETKQAEAEAAQQQQQKEQQADLMSKAAGPAAGAMAKGMADNPESMQAMSQAMSQQAQPQ